MKRENAIPTPQISPLGGFTPIRGAGVPHPSPPTSRFLQSAGPPAPHQIPVICHLVWRGRLVLHYPPPPVFFFHRVVSYTCPVCHLFLSGSCPVSPALPVAVFAFPAPTPVLLCPPRVLWGLSHPPPCSLLDRFAPPCPSTCARSKISLLWLPIHISYCLCPSFACPSSPTPLVGLPITPPLDSLRTPVLYYQLAISF